MKEKMIKALHTCPLGTGGVTSMVLNICDHMDRSTINFDYLKYSSKKGFSEDRALALGGRVYAAYNDDATNSFMKFWLKFYRCYTACKKAKLDIFHINASTPYDTLIGIGAKLAGVKRIIVHSHNANNTDKSKLKNLINKFCKIIMPLYVDAYFTCSTEAAQYMFPACVVKNEKYCYIHNGIDTKKFAYNETIRQRLRKENGLENKVVFANVGRFFKQKNHEFLIEIFANIAKKRDDAVLLLVGEGEMQDFIKEKVNKMGLKEKVIFWGASNRINELMQMMDVMLMPSLHEGLPVVGIEAQVSGLLCVFLDGLTKEVDITHESIFLPLNQGPDYWANTIMMRLNENRERNNNEIIAKKMGYDIEDVARSLTNEYIKLFSEQGDK